MKRVSRSWTRASYPARQAIWDAYADNPGFFDEDSGAVGEWAGRRLVPESHVDVLGGPDPLDYIGEYEKRRVGRRALEGLRQFEAAGILSPEQVVTARGILQPRSNTASEAPVAHVPVTVVQTSSETAQLELFDLPLSA